jgi:hypothetical protein
MPLAVFAGEKELVEKFFSPDGIKNKKDLYVGEMLKNYADKPTLGENLPKDVQVHIRELEISPSREIYAVLLSKSGKSQDWYIYMTNEQGKWKISAVRNLALPGIFFMALQKAHNKTDRSKEEEYQYQNMLLTIQPDAELKEFLLKNIDSFNRIAKEAINNPDKATESVKALNLNFARYEPESKIVDVNIGGILDNSVGYLYIPEGASVPSMSDDNYIYIERIQGNWYVYKTT